MFGRVDPLEQGFRGVPVKHGNCLLPNDWPGIHTCVNQVHRAASDFDAIIQCLLPGFQTGKARQE